MPHHPAQDVEAALLGQPICDRPGVGRRRRRQAERVADDDVHVRPALEIHRDVDGLTVWPDKSISAVLVAAVVLHVLGAAVRLANQLEFPLEGSPPSRENHLAVGCVERGIAVDMVNRLTGAAMARAGNDLPELRMQIFARGDPAGHHDLSGLTLLRLHQMRG